MNRLAYQFPAFIELSTPPKGAALEGVKWEVRRHVQDADRGDVLEPRPDDHWELALTVVIAGRRYCVIRGVSDVEVYSHRSLRLLADIVWRDALAALERGLNP